MNHALIHALMVKEGVKKAEFLTEETAYQYTWISDREYRFGERGYIPDVYWV